MMPSTLSQVFVVPMIVSIRADHDIQTGPGGKRQFGRVCIDDLLGSRKGDAVRARCVENIGASGDFILAQTSRLLGKLLVIDMHFPLRIDDNTRMNPLKIRGLVMTTGADQVTPPSFEPEMRTCPFSVLSSLSLTQATQS